MKDIIHYLSFYSDFIVCWIIGFSVFFTLRLRFVNFRLLPHAFSSLVHGHEKDAGGEISPFQALMLALSGTVGLGNIAGTALGVFLGGPGVVLWMVVAGMLGMCMKFAEISMAHKYRFVDSAGRVVGGSFEYIRTSLSFRGFRGLGSFVAMLYAVLLLVSVFLGGNMFQANQLFNLLDAHYFAGTTLSSFIPFLLAGIVAVSTFGGMRLIGIVMAKTLPIASVTFFVTSFIVVGFHSDKILWALHTIWDDAFTGRAAGIGMIGVMFIGIQRAFYASTAGLGISTVIHASAQTDNPVREGCIGMLEPLLDTVLICAVCGLAIVTSGAAQGFDNELLQSSGGILIADKAYGGVSSLVGTMLHICVACFAISVITSLRCVGLVAWNYIFSERCQALFNVAYALSTYFGAIASFGVIMQVADFATLSLAIPNAIGLALMSKEVAQDKDAYIAGIKSQD